jgi:hypothetical protein
MNRPCAVFSFISSMLLKYFTSKKTELSPQEIIRREVYGLSSVKAQT